MQRNLDRIQKDGKIMMLAYDQGLEHGPEDFDDRNYNPEFILDIGNRGGYTCMTMQFANARKFWLPKYSHIPMIVKLNGKTKLGPEALSVTNSSVDDAISIGASGVGFTIYLGSEHEAEMIREFSEIRRQGHRYGLAVIAWMYPFITQPSSNDDEIEADIVAYAARAGAELGADAVKIKYPRQPEALPWIIKNAVGTKAILSGGDKASDEEFTGKVRAFMDAGGAGIAVGRNAWQHEDPLAISHKAKEIIWPNSY